jgi:hypothetical protein
MSEEKKFERTEPMNPGDEAPQGTTGAGENICGDCRGTGKREGKSRQRPVEAQDA